MAGLGGLHQGAHAFGAQHHLNLSPVFQDGYALEVGAKCPPGGLFGPWAILTEGSMLTTVCTFSHLKKSFLTTIA